MVILAALGDKRYAYMAAQARAAGHTCYTYGINESSIPGVEPIDKADLSTVECVVAPNIFAGKNAQAGEELLEMLPIGTNLCLFCTNGMEPELEERFNVIDLSKDEAFTSANAELTAEGAIYTAMARASHSIMGSNCLIIGYGRIGNALTERLVALGAHVTVAARRDSARKMANQRGAYAISIDELPDALPRQQIIFSTPPQLVIGTGELRRISDEAIIIDLASPPYGVDFEAARELNMRAWLEPALPGRYCPESAGYALLKAVETALKEVY